MDADNAAGGHGWSWDLELGFGNFLVRERGDELEREEGGFSGLPCERKKISLS